MQGAQTAAWCLYIYTQRNTDAADGFLQAINIKHPIYIYIFYLRVYHKLCSKRGEGLNAGFPGANMLWRHLSSSESCDPSEVKPRRRSFRGWNEKKKVGGGLAGCWLTAVAERRTPLPAVEASEPCDRDSRPHRREREGQLRGDIDRFTPPPPLSPYPTHTHTYTQNPGTPVCTPPLPTTTTTPHHSTSSPGGNAVPA